MAKITGFGKEEERVPSGLKGTCKKCQANVVTEGNEKSLASHANQHFVSISYLIRCPNCNDTMWVD